MALSTEAQAVYLALGEEYEARVQALRENRARALELIREVRGQAAVDSVRLAKPRLVQPVGFVWGRRWGPGQRVCISPAFSLLPAPAG